MRKCSYEKALPDNLLCHLGMQTCCLYISLALVVVMYLSRGRQTELP